MLTASEKTHHLKEYKKGNAPLKSMQFVLFACTDSRLQGVLNKVRFVVKFISEIKHLGLKSCQRVKYGGPFGFQ